jgi:hypothetical protein
MVGTPRCGVPTISGVALEDRRPTFSLLSSLPSVQQFVAIRAIRVKVPIPVRATPTYLRSPSPHPQQQSTQINPLCSKSKPKANGSRPKNISVAPEAAFHFSFFLFLVCNIYFPAI